MPLRNFENWVRALILVCISALHVFALIFLNQMRQKPAPKVDWDAIEVVVVSLPTIDPPIVEPEPEQELETPSPETIEEIRVRPERLPARKPKRPQIITATPNPNRQNPQSREQERAARYGAFYVDPNFRGQSAFGAFSLGFDCSRMERKMWTKNCRANGVNLMRGMEGKVAAVRARMARRAPPRRTANDNVRGIQSRVPPVSGKPQLGESFGAIPPEYPDPGFGD